MGKECWFRRFRWFCVFCNWFEWYLFYIWVGVAKECVVGFVASCGFVYFIDYLNGLFGLDMG